MQRIFVDFARGEDLDQRVEIGFADAWQLQGYELREGEHAILYETGSLEVEGILHQETRQSKAYWYAVPDWATRKDLDATAYLTGQA